MEIYSHNRIVTLLKSCASQEQGHVQAMVIFLLLMCRICTLGCECAVPRSPFSDTYHHPARGRLR